MITALEVLAFVVLVVRVICVAASLRPSSFSGRRIRHFVLAVSFAGLAMGGLFVVAGHPAGGAILLCSTALKFVSDRRIAR